MGRSLPHLMQLVLKLRSISDGHTWTSAAGVDLGKRAYPQFDDPVSWRYDKGHELAKNADWLGEQLDVKDGKVNYKATPQCGGFFPNEFLKIMPQYASGILNGLFNR